MRRVPILAASLACLTGRAARAQELTDRYAPHVLRTGALIVLLACWHASAAAQARTLRPNDVGGELGGKALVVSAAFQRMVTSWAGLQVGYMSFGEAPNDDTAESIFPLSGAIYLLPGDSAPFATGGVTVVRYRARTDAYPHAGLGYERRSNGSFVFRAALYAIVAGDRSRTGDWSLPSVGRVIVWPGIYFGYSF